MTLSSIESGRFIRSMPGGIPALVVRPVRTKVNAFAPDIAASPRTRMLMPDTPYLIAVIAVLAAVVFAVWVARLFGARSAGPQVTAVEVPSALAETQSALAAALSQVDQLTERLRQTQAV